jgi:cysteinyl-tRNA synthetase
LAAFETGIDPGQVLWIVAAMVGARNAAMGFNRLADHSIDSRNPRTADRELPARRLTRPAVWTFTLALAALFVFLRDVNSALDRSHGRATQQELAQAQAALDSIDSVFGLLEVASALSGDDDAELAAWVDDMIEQRKQARTDRDWGRADEIRDELAARGVVLEDTPQGTRWKRA